MRDDFICRIARNEWRSSVNALRSLEVCVRISNQLNREELYAIRRVICMSECVCIIHSFIVDCGNTARATAPPPYQANM